MANIFDKFAAEGKTESPAGKGNIFHQLAAQEPQESTLKQRGRSLFQVPLGLAERFTWAANLIDPASREILREVSEGDENIIPEIAEAARAKAESFVPTQQRLEKLIEEKTGLPLQPKTRGQRLMRLAGAAKQPGRILPSVVAPSVSAGVEQLGAPENVADLAGLLASAFIHGKPKEVQQKKVTPIEPSSKTPGLLDIEIERLPSGLTKPKAVGSEHAGKGIITKEIQQKAIQKLDEEASKITKGIIEKRLPLAKKIQEGHDFRAEWQEGFGKLENVAGRANPTMDITDISEYLGNYLKKYRGFAPELLPPDIKKSVNIAKAFREHPNLQLKNLLKLYRLNNNRVNDIYEKSFVGGKRKELVDFLLDFNRSIVKTFERTLPADSQWLKDFKKLNSDFSQYTRTQKTLNALESVLQARVKSSTLDKFADDVKTQRKLILNMGEDGAKEVIQVAKDLKLAREAIKKIPVKEWSKWDAIFPLSVFIPGIHVPGGLAALKKGFDYGRRAYGWYLTTPARRAALDKAANAITKGDIKAYEEAADILKNVTK